jgi:thiol-disulfide isomerase/thioredoxin
MNAIIPEFCREWSARLVLAALLAVMPVAASTAESRQLDEYEGKVVMLDFWASWCVPCRRSFPWMNEMQQTYADRGLVVIAVNLDNNSDDAASFLQEYPAKFRIVYDTDKKLAREFEVQAMPTSYLIGRDGKVADMHLGFKVKQQHEYEAAIRKTLEQN